MDFEALMKNSLPFWVYCVCTNWRDGLRQELPPPDLLLHSVVMENKKIRSGAKSRGGYGDVSGHGCCMWMQIAIQSDKAELLAVMAV